MSNRRRVIVPVKSRPSLSDSTEHVAAPGDAEMVRFVCSSASRSFASARLSCASLAGQTVSGVLVFFVNSFAKCLISLSSIASPPTVWSESVASENARPWRMERRVTVSAEAPRSTRSCVRSALRPSGGGPEVVVTAAAPASSRSCRTVMSASFAAFSSASF